MLLLPAPASPTIDRHRKKQSALTEAAVSDIVVRDNAETMKFTNG
jgi:hypothetical protein